MEEVNFLGWPTNNIRVLHLSERAPASHQTSNIRGPSSHLLHFTCSHCVILLLLLVLGSCDPLPLHHWQPGCLRITVAAAPVVRELRRNQVLVTYIDSPGTYTWTNPQLTGQLIIPLFLNTFSSRESMTFLCLDIGPLAQ